MQNTNLPWILISIEMTLSDIEMKLKLMELVKLMGMSVIDGSIKDNSFQFSKRQKNVIKNFCSNMFNRKGESSEFQIVIQFIKDKYNRLVEIRSLKGNNYINELTICTYIKKCILFSKSMKIERVCPGYFMNLEDVKTSIIGDKANIIQDPVSSQLIEKNNGKSVLNSDDSSKQKISENYNKVKEEENKNTNIINGNDNSNNNH